MNPYLLLAAAEGCGPGMIRALLDPSTDPNEVLAAPPPLPPAARTRLGSDRMTTQAQSWIDQSASLGIVITTPDDPGYPPKLRDAPLRPNALFSRGDLSLLDGENPHIAIVGSRTPTAYGEAAAADFAGAVARAGIAIASGLAYGVDAQSHRAAVQAGTPTIAVLAGGLDQIYPRAHDGLADRIVGGGGLLISESPPGRRAMRGHFPRRNRILASCADAVLVIEAGLQSGSLHTAKFATEYGTAVFAVPGPYTSPRSRGCHALIAMGAQITVSPAEFLRDIGVEAALRRPEVDEREFLLSADEEAVLRVLREGPRPADLVARESRLARGAFLTALFSLRQKGRILEMAGDVIAAMA